MNSCCICTTCVYVSLVGYSMDWRTLHYGCWMLQRKKNMWQCIWFMEKFTGKVFKLLLELFVDVIVTEFAKRWVWRGALPPLMQACMMLTLFLACYRKVCLFRSQDLVRENEPLSPPRTSAFTTQTLLLCCCCLFLQQEHPFPGGKLSNTFHSMVSSARINWCWCSPLSLHHYHNLATSELISCCKSIRLLSKLVLPLKSLSRPLNTRDTNVFRLKMSAVPLAVVAGAQESQTPEEFVIHKSIKRDENRQKI